MKAWPVGKTALGKTDYKITSYEVDHLEIMHNGSKVCCTYPFDARFRSPLVKQCVTNFVEIPCGKCIGCRIEYSRQWANRMMLELEYHDSAYFVTLTYNDDHVPRALFSDLHTGEAFESLTLCKRDVQLFFKRLRKAFPDDKIRFYLAGEYGSNTFRPHYHAIIFGLHLDDLQVFSKSKQGFCYYSSAKLQRCWSQVLTGESYSPNDHNIGFCLVSEVTWETCAYVARYVTKKLTGPESSYYEYFNLTPPFTLMSRKPGIGRQWYDDHPDCFDYEYINLKTSSGGRKFRPPKYYQKLYEVDEPDAAADMKETRRQMAEAQKQLKLAQTDLSYLEMLAVEEQQFHDRTKILMRRDFDG